MKKKLKWYIKERIKRINYIKTELNRLVGKSLFKNTYNTTTNSLISCRYLYYKNIKYNTITNFKLFCMLNISSKIVNKKYRLSRFSLNKLAKTADIQGLVKRGW